MSLWWRAECGSIDHPKLLKLSDSMHRAWYTLMCVAGANGGALPPTEDIAIRLRMNKAKVAEWITKLVQADLFDNVDGVFVPHNWTKRQYKSDKTDPTAAERMKRFRKNKKDRNAVTNETGRNDRNCTVMGLRPEAEANSEANSEQSRADACAPVDEDLRKREAGLLAGIAAHFAARAQTMPSNTDRVAVWLSEGYAAGTVLKAVETVLKRGKPVSTLEYFDGAIKDAHAKAAPEKLQVVSSKVFVIVGTQGWISWDTEHRAANNGRGLPTTQHQIGNVIRDGWWCTSEFAPGWDEATGEKLPPSAEDAA